MTNPTSETALQKEQQLFRELVARLIDALLNSMFDLHPEKAARRSSNLLFLFLLSVVFITIIYFPSEWASNIDNLWQSVTKGESISAVTGFFSFLLKTIQEPSILQYLPVFLASFFIALQTAAMYLTDVFELDDVSVARRFINSVALSGSNETIKIKHGEIADESRELPVYLIGGPGKVVVELDSVAVFERADGTPHIIGPTGKETGGKATLEGFERFRQAIDIRDHHITLRDQDDKSKAVKSRSRDGIPIKATDVRLMYSVFRGDNPDPSEENPYPFSKEAVEKIVYNAASRVTPELLNPSTFEFSWTNNMVGLIRGRLGNFMNQHKLTEYLASIGKPEFDKFKEREGKIIEEKQEVAQPGDDVTEQKETTPVEGRVVEDDQELKHPNNGNRQNEIKFQARDEVKSLFTQFTDEFTRKARNNGVELHWIGVGTWESPVKNVAEKHLEAWAISHENLKNDNPEKIKKIEQEEVVNKLKELIKKVPINAYEEIIDYTYESKRQSFKRRGARKTLKSSEEHEEGTISAEEMAERAFQILGDLEDGDSEQKNAHREADHSTDLRTLLAKYRNHLGETADLIKDKSQEVPHTLVSAIELLSKMLGYKDYHWVGQSQSDTTKEKTEDDLYTTLVNMVGGDNPTADKWIEYELKRYPNETRSQLIQRAIDNLKRGK